MARVLVVGASGTLGRDVVPALKRYGHWVRGTSRDAARVPREVDEAVAADLLDPASLHAACEGMEVVVQAAGASPVSLTFRLDRRGFAGVDTVGTRHLVEAAEAAGVRRFVYVSVAGPSALDATPYVAAHREAERIVYGSGMDAVIIRPTGFFSAFEAYLPLVRLGVMPMIGDGTVRTNPIHQADLAEVVAKAVEGEETLIEAGGPEVLTRHDIGVLAFEAVGKRPRFVGTPDALIRFNTRTMGLLDQRLGEVLAFVHAIHHTDIVAPPRGTQRLGPYLSTVAASPSA